MPVYCYACKECKYEFEIRHAMSFEDQHCTECGSLNVFKVPSIDIPRKFFSPAKAGKIVDEYIKDAKLEIKKEKSKIKGKEL